MSGGGSTQTATTTSGPPAWLQPYQQSYLQQANTVANQPYTQSPTQVAAPNAFQTQGYQALANRAVQGSPVQSQANQALTNTMGGDYLGQGVARNTTTGTNPFASASNPYLNQSIDLAQRDVVRNYNNVAKPQMEAAMVRSGSFGNSGLMSAQRDQQQDLQRSLGDISTNMRMADYTQRAGLTENAVNRQFQAGQQFTSDRNNAYQSERNRMLQSMGLAPQFAQSDYNDAQQLINAGNLAQNNVNAQNAQNYQWWLESQQYPQQQLGVIGDAMRTVLGSNSQTTQTQPGTSTGASVLGGALTAAQIYRLLNGG